MTLVSIGAISHFNEWYFRSANVKLSRLDDDWSSLTCYHHNMIIMFFISLCCFYVYAVCFDLNTISMVFVKKTVYVLNKCTYRWHLIKGLPSFMNDLNINIYFIQNALLSLVYFQCTLFLFCVYLLMIMQCSFVRQLFAKIWMNAKWLNVDIKL